MVAGESSGIMIYLKNIVSKLILLSEEVKSLRQKVTTLGRGNSQAFIMCKQCINTLAANQEEVYDTLMESAGIIEEITWA